MKKLLFILIGISLLVSGCNKKDKITYEPVDRKVHEQLIVDFYNHCLNNPELDMCISLEIEKIDKIKVIEPIYSHDCRYGDYYCYNVVVVKTEKDAQQNYENMFITIIDNKIEFRYLYKSNEYWPKD